MPFDNTPQTTIPKLPGPVAWHPHYEAVLNWVLLNPHRNDAEGAKELGFTHTWFSIIINSDIFQEKLRERATEMGVALAPFAQGIYGKMLHAADLAMDETIRKLEAKTGSETFISNTRDALLDRLFDKQSQSPARDGSSAVKHVHVHASSLREARHLLDTLGSVEDATVVSAQPAPSTGGNDADSQKAQTETAPETGVLAND